MRVASRVISVFCVFFFVFTPECVLSDSPNWHGLTVKKITTDLMAKHGLVVPFGVVVTKIHPEGAASTADFRVGDLIQGVNGKASLDEQAFSAALSAAEAGTRVEFAGMRGKTGFSTAMFRPVPTHGTSARILPTTPPLLMLDTGGHMSKIQRAFFTPNGRYIVSAGNDKVIRIWDWRAGKTVRTIRGFSKIGDIGTIYAMDLSADGKLLAVGGWTKSRDHEIRLFDYRTGRLLSLLRGHTNVVNSLAFSPDGKKLVSGGGGRPALAYVWDISRPSEPEMLHKLSGHVLSIYAVRFSPDSKRVVTASDDSTLRLWQVDDGSLIKEMRGHRGDLDRSLAVRRSDGLIASGDLQGEIRLWDGKTGEFKHTLAEIGAGVGALDFTPDGSKLVVTQRRRPLNVYVLDVETGETLTTFKGHDNIVLAAHVSPDGKLVATAGGNRRPIHIWHLDTGERIRDKAGKKLSLVGTGDSRLAAGFLAGGHAIAWGNTPRYKSVHNRGPLQYMIRLPKKGRRLGKPARIKDGQTFLRARPTFREFSLTHRRGGEYRSSTGTLVINRDDEPIATVTRSGTDGYRHRSYTFVPDGTAIVSGGAGGVLEKYDLDGRRLHKISEGFVGHEGDIWAVTPSADGRFLVSASADQTIRLWNLKTRELVVTLFHGRDGKWVMWTPQGFYTGSPGAGDLVGWQINKGPDKAADYITGQQVRKKLLRPDIVERAVILASAEAAVREAGLEQFTIADILADSPPRIRMDGERQASGGRGTLGILFEPNDLPVTGVSAFVDGVQVTLKEKAPPAGKPTVHPDGSKLKVYDVPLHKGRNVVRVVARNSAGESVARTLVVNHIGEGDLDKRGTLWVLSVGVDKYPGVGAFYKDLNYAGADAREFAKTVSAKMRGDHDRLDVTVLVNGGKQGEPTAANITTALTRIADLSRDNDTVVVFMAGHGEVWRGGRYHFLPTDVTRPARDQIGENILNWTVVKKAITKTKGRRLLFVDACRTGADGYNAKLLQDANADGYIAFNAAAVNQSAHEYHEERHGAFAHALILGFKGNAVDQTVGGVTLYELGSYVYKHVVKRTGGVQTPEYYPGRDGNIVLARTNNN